VQIRTCQVAISADVNGICRGIGRYAVLPEAGAEVSQLNVILGKLKAIQVQLNAFEEPQLTRFVNLEAALKENAQLLETLAKPTHEFAPIKREDVSKVNRFGDPEGLVRSAVKTRSYAVEEKCGKCGARRKSTPVGIG
jgi:hypothetical protein